jgi:ribokinase
MESVSILVVGSSVLDQVSRVERFPIAGESVRGTDVQLFSGGKGANQAVTVARLGATTTFCTCVGNDANGHYLLQSLKAENIDCAHVEFIQSASTGTAMIALNDEGQNMIIACLGANMQFSPDFAFNVSHKCLHSVLLLQAEIPLETVRAAAEASQGLVVFNPAPSISLPGSIYPLVDFMTPNEHEAAHLVGFSVRNSVDADRAADELLARGCKNVVITLGPLGAFYKNQNEYGLVKAPRVNVVDTVGAGDCFNGALAFAIAHQTPIHDAVCFAVGCASMSVAHLGAQSGLPYFDELPVSLQELMLERKKALRNS